jgi:hypothetical protein
MKAILSNDLKLKDGTVYLAGDVAELSWLEAQPNITIATIHGRDIRLATTRLHKYFNIAKCPTLNTMERWSDDGVARSVLGKRVEPDGHDAYGSPSWMLVVGII